MAEFPAYPASFPDAVEQRFLTLLLCDDAAFPALWARWREETEFDDIGFAILRLLPLLHRRIAALGIRDEAVTGRIGGAHKMVWVKNQRLLEEVRRVLALCREHDIPVLALKGLALLVDVYRDPGARFMSDGDLLVRPEDAPRLFDLLSASNWRHVAGSGPTPSVFRRMGPRRLSHSSAFDSPNGIRLDIHWEALARRKTNRDAWRLVLLLGPSGRLPRVTEAMWRHAKMGAIRGEPCAMPAREDLLFHVVVHGARGNSHPTLRWATDAAAIIEAGGIDWDRLLETARSNGCAVDLRTAMTYLTKELGVPVPPAVLAALDAMPVSVEQQRQYHWRATRAQRTSFGKVASHWYLYWTADTDASVAARCLAFPAYLRDKLQVGDRVSLPRFVIGRLAARLWRRLTSERVAGMEG